MRKEILRLAARSALERRLPGVPIAIVRSQGVVPGARLEYEEKGRMKEVAVRTSKDRKVGLLRDRNGKWRTVTNPKVKLVLIAAPASDDGDLIEVLAFDPEKLVNGFDRAVANAGKADREKGPVFLPLDEHRRGFGARKPGLKSECEWKTTLKKSEVRLSGAMAESAQALEIIRAGIAEGLGVSPDRIDLSVSFTVKPSVS
jgi:hypothetical protein